ncbi:MAG: NapC/NirT family cytochrome c [Candidatus Omnitrophica bacterium]|nr:NapC/NirT family cytochrome c [Candidatus Omnitrophota bacterium]
MSEKDRKIFSDLFYNKISYAGIALAVVVFAIECVLFGLDYFSGNSNSYLSLFTYVVLPPFLILGLLLIPWGALRKKRNIRLGLAAPGKEPIVFDISNPTHRNAALVFFVGTVIFLIMTAIGTYKAYNFTESVTFCGTTCHVIMKPEYTAYLNSPHARVKCVECHIGSGAGWYVHSKLSGARQVVKTLMNNYARPIPVPVNDLRPAKDTCEECHWPGKSFSAIEFDRTYFPSEPGAVAQWNLRMLMHVSGSGQGKSGIHAHMNNNNTIYYAADDEKRQNISWVKSVSKEGKETIYIGKDSPYRTVPPPASKIRVMDCIDCHSRPSHHYEAPMPIVDRAMAEGKIDPGIPLIKAKAVEVLAKKYQTEAEAVNSIESTLLKYYKEKQHEYFQTHEKQVHEGIAGVVTLYKNNFFPEMKVRWDGYPDNIGHMISPGCFRCHDGEHLSVSGKTITRACDTCHTIIGQGPSDNMEKNLDGIAFRHPFDNDESWKEMSCTTCHSGS